MKARQVIAPNWIHNRNGNSLDLRNTNPYIEIYICEEGANHWQISFRTTSSDLYLLIFRQLIFAGIPNLFFNNYGDYYCFALHANNAAYIWQTIGELAKVIPLADKMPEIMKLLRLNNPTPIKNNPHPNEAQPEVPSLQQQNADLLRLNEELRREIEKLKSEISTLKEYYNPPLPSAPPQPSESPKFFK